MLTRICLIGVVAAGCLLAVLGLLTMPMTAVSTWAFVAVFTGSLVAMCLYSVRSDRGHAMRVGAMASAGTLATVLAVAGLAGLLGPVAAVVVPLLLAAGVWWYRRRPAGASTPGPMDLERPPRGSVRRPEPIGPTVPRINTATVPTQVLCAAWHRTYWLLRDLPTASPDRPVVIEIRGRLLDEFERRDSDGFGRWLRTDPRACSDPGKYLRADH